MERGKSSIISTIVLSTIIVLTIIFIVIVLKTGGKVSSDIGGVDLSGGITMEKQMALTVNANLRSYMDSQLSYDRLKMLISVAKTNNSDAKSKTDYKNVYFKYGGEIITPDELERLVSSGKQYSAKLNNSNKSDNEEDNASYDTNGQIKLIEVTQIQ